MGFKNAEKRSTVAAQTTGYALGDVSCFLICTVFLLNFPKK